MDNTVNGIEIPLGLKYLDGQSSLDFGLDCLGLVSLVYPELQNSDYYSLTLGQGLNKLTELGFIESAEGCLGVMVLGRKSYHLVLISEDNSFVYHASKTRGCVVKDDYLILRHLIYKRFKKQ